MENDLPLISWENICRPRCEGGLGIRRVEDLNAVMLAKLRWEVIIDPKNLWVKVVSAKYLSKENFLDAKKKRGFNNVEIHPRS